MEREAPELGVQSLSHWTTREVPGVVFLKLTSAQLIPLLKTLSLLPTATKRESRLPVLMFTLDAVPSDLI